MNDSGDEGKSREQLIEELGALRRRLADLEQPSGGKLAAELAAVNAMLQADVEKRRQVEEQLRTSEARLAQAMDLARLASWEFDVATGMFHFDDRYYALHGTTSAREGGPLMSAEVFARELVHPDSAALVGQKTHEAIATDDPNFTVEVGSKILRRDGEVRHLRVRFRVVKDEAGKTVKLFGVNQDVTEMARAEEALRESKLLVDSVVDNAPFMIFVKEAAEHRFVIFNRAGEELLGYPRSALLGKNDRDLFPPEQAAFFMAKDREVLDAGVTLDIPEEPIDTAKKGRRLLHTTKVCIRGEDGATKYLLGISEDITERKQHEAALRESAARYARAVRGTADGIWEWHVQTNEYYLSPRGKELLGFTDAELPNELSALYSRAHPDERARLQEAMRSHVDDQVPYDVQVPLETKSGEYRWFHLRGEAERDEGGKAVVVSGAISDITDERERALAELHEQAHIIDLQSKAILELSTPVMQVWQGILVAPLIGTVDTARAQQIVESLLEAIVKSSASVVILDITGVPTVDTKVAHHLLKTVAAARLLGAEVVLTGMGPLNAQTLVRLGVDLGKVTTRSSLQTGLRYAFERAGLSVRAKAG